LGEIVYVDDGADRATVHGECLAQKFLADVQETAKSREQAQAKKNKSQHEEYDIGWKVERIPRNIDVARKLGCETLNEHNLCGVALEQGAVRVAETMDPSTSVNLEYLSIALQVRGSDGREPLFSLDPVDSSMDPERTMQRKHFEPQWLMGTSVGEVMFQADYYLKELSMGEYEQPVIGMRSCFDFSREDQRQQEWNAREWFVVNKAEVYVSTESVLMPYVELGIEAREQIQGDAGDLTDAAITRHDHPLVRYAEQFTHNFDLIAERKSVIYHLRELAKASVLAKFMLDRKVRMDRVWFDAVDWLAAENAASKLPTEVPQIWRGRWLSRVDVQDGKILGAEKGLGLGTSECKSLYGGVEFGLERFRLARAKDVPLQMKRVGQATAAGIGAQINRVTTGVEAGLAAFVSRSAGVPEAAITSASEEVGAPLQYGAPAAEVVRGVDLNLNGFDLTPKGERASQVPNGRALFGSGFWTEIDGAKGDEDLGFLKDVFNSKHSDRRDEGESFVGPSMSPVYLQKLKGLVQEEAKVREERLAHFMSEDFVIGDAGPLFPAAWTSSVEGHTQNQPRQLEVCLFEDAVDLAALKADVAPVFEKCTEDGVRFRVYHWRGFEVRTSQQPNSAESVAVIFSVEESERGLIPGSEKVVKITEYVSPSASAKGEGKGPQGSQRDFRFHLILETEHGRHIATEGRLDGKVAWEEQPADLEERRASSKTLGYVVCQGARITVQDVRRYTEAHGTFESSHAGCKRYAKGLYNWACSQSGKDPRGLERYISAKAA
jgi:hypothetical protein